MKKILSLIAILLFSITLVGCQPNECPPSGDECEICEQCEKCELSIENCVNIMCYVNKIRFIKICLKK